MSTWTFGGVPFTWLSQDTNGHPSKPTFNAEERIVIRPHLDSGDADVDCVGFEAQTVSGPIYVAAASVAALKAKKGTQATLSDGTSSWTVVMKLKLSDLSIGETGASGEATFIRPRASA